MRRMDESEMELALDASTDCPVKKALQALANDPILKGLKPRDERGPGRARPSWRNEVPELGSSNGASSAGTAEQNPCAQTAAGEVIRWLAEIVEKWRTRLSGDEHPAIVAMLNGGVQMNVERVAQASAQAIHIEGTIGNKRCTVLAHPATVQLLCIIEKVEKEKTRCHPPAADGLEQEL